MNKTFLKDVHTLQMSKKKSVLELGESNLNASLHALVGPASCLDDIITKALYGFLKSFFFGNLSVTVHCQQLDLSRNI